MPRGAHYESLVILADELSLAQGVEQYLLAARKREAQLPAICFSEQIYIDTHC